MRGDRNHSEGKGGKVTSSFLATVAYSAFMDYTFKVEESRYNSISFVSLTLKTFIITRRVGRLAFSGGLCRYVGTET